MAEIGCFPVNFHSSVYFASYSITESVQFDGEPKCVVMSATIILRCENANDTNFEDTTNLTLPSGRTTDYAFPLSL